MKRTDADVPAVTFVGTLYVPGGMAGTGLPGCDVAIMTLTTLTLPTSGFALAVAQPFIDALS